MDEQQPPIRVLPWCNRLYKVGRARVRVLKAPPFDGDGITVREWELLALPYEVGFMLISLAPHAEFGRRGARAPGTWKRLWNIVREDTGRIHESYCQGRPRSWCGVALRIPCLHIWLTWRTPRQRAALYAHGQGPCTVCGETSGGWKRTVGGDAT
ncbi:hypothetical protein EV284_6424 [Streptomyces sp. BK022]|uniref:hypothetical protein n=1 Tax=Streptomyces sp. BK022 TaxID=2512123 RepID=UPI001029843E|nr:hypothetical protein [Streptomyces sp. BK022]RZU28258.1 hypothetical protein EV284_6424 [Streptomyces sp. BK022]